MHFWGAIGYNFKSPLIRYSVSTNKNGKMSQRTYIDAVLSTEVLAWTKECAEWVLEKDGDLGHGKAQNNGPVERYKRSIGMSRTEGPHRYYFNCQHSPDFAPIEDAWSYPKKFVKKQPHWTDAITEELAKEAWAQIPQNWLNKCVDSIPQRLQDCIDSGGQLVQMRS